MQIALDLDGVIAEIGDLRVPEVVARFAQPGFFASLVPVPGAIAGVAAVQRRHEVVICSSAMFVPHAFGEKFAWLRSHLPFVDPARLVFCGDKSIIAADVLVDDGVDHLRAFAGRGILFETAANARDPYSDRARDWPALLGMLGC